MVVAGDGQEYLLLLRGDHMLNEVKAAKKLALQRRLPLRDRKPKSGSASVRRRARSGRSDVDLPVHRRPRAAAMSDFVCGANEDGYH